MKDDEIGMRMKIQLRELRISAPNWDVVDLFDGRVVLADCSLSAANAYVLAHTPGTLWVRRKDFQPSLPPTYPYAA